MVAKWPYRLWEINNSMSPSQSLLESEGDFKLMNDESQSILIKRVRFPDYTREPWDVYAKASSGWFV